MRTPVAPDEHAAGRFPCQHLQDALQAAIRAGDDTDTVAAIAGGLLGARWGASAVPFGWRRSVHGWPNHRARDLVRLAVLTAHGGRGDAQGWPLADRLYPDVRPRVAVPLPADPEVLLGTVAVADLDADAVVSLCRLGRLDVSVETIRPEDHLEAWLIDKTDPAENPNLTFVIDDAARAVAALRDEGRRVLLHCVHAQSRTPTVAARYAVLRGSTVEQAQAMVLQALPDASPNPTLWKAMAALGEGSARDLFEPTATDPRP